MKFLLLAFIISLLIITGCDPSDGKLTPVNNSKDTIFFSFSYKNDNTFSYPLIEINGNIDYEKSDVLFPHSASAQPVIDSWENFINNKCKGSTLTIFFFTKKLIDSIKRDSIMNYHLFTKKKKFKVYDLEHLKWRIMYP